MADGAMSPGQMYARVAFTVTQAAEAAGVSDMTIRRAHRSGALEVHYPTSRPVILRDDLVRWIEASPTEPPS